MSSIIIKELKDYKNSDGSNMPRHEFKYGMTNPTGDWAGALAQLRGLFYSFREIKSLKLFSDDEIEVAPVDDDEKDNTRRFYTNVLSWSGNKSLRFGLDGSGTIKTNSMGAPKMVMVEENPIDIVLAYHLLEVVSDSSDSSNDSSIIDTSDEYFQKYYNFSSRVAKRIYDLWSPIYKRRMNKFFADGFDKDYIFKYYDDPLSNNGQVIFTAFRIEPEDSGYTWSVVTDSAHYDSSDSSVNGLNPSFAPPPRYVFDGDVRIFPTGLNSRQKSKFLNNKQKTSLQRRSTNLQGKRKVSLNLNESMRNFLDRSLKVLSREAVKEVAEACDQAVEQNNGTPEQKKKAKDLCTIAGDVAQDFWTAGAPAPDKPVTDPNPDVGVDGSPSKLEAMTESVQFQKTADAATPSGSVTRKGIYGKGESTMKVDNEDDRILNKKIEEPVKAADKEEDKKWWQRWWIWFLLVLLVVAIILLILFLTGKLGGKRKRSRS